MKLHAFLIALDTVAILALWWRYRVVSRMLEIAYLQLQAAIGSIEDEMVDRQCDTEARICELSTHEFGGDGFCLFCGERHSYPEEAATRP